MKITALRKTWMSGASLAAVLFVTGLTPAEARVIADDHTAAHAEESRTAGEAVSDAWITTKVKSKLLADGDVSGLDISVETRNNVVYLSGEAESQTQVTRASELARDTEGVARVDATALRVETATGQVRDAVDNDPPRSARADERANNPDARNGERSAGEVINDAWITTKVKSKLLADGDVSGLDISVETRNNVVHLSGEAESQAQVSRATELARDTEGVARVDATALRVETATAQVDRAVTGNDGGFRPEPMSTQTTPPPAQATPPRAEPTPPRAERAEERSSDRSAGEAINDGWITTKVKSKLLADRDVSGFDISVETRDNVVHLEGEVETQAQIDEAVRLATETEGVARVDASGLRIGGN